MNALCETGAHLIQKLPDSGRYTCVYCGLMFHEHHEITIAVGTAAQPHGR